ncbi:hypothetical protein MMC07_007003 [Pseudocyphellaria aurata]|nr:hypothetical protein [Pseudocyphellaria aurata]
MVSKIAVALLAALATTTQAGHAQHHHAKRHYGYGSVPNNSTSVVPQLTPSVSPVPISASSVPVGTGLSASPFSVSSGTNPSASLLPSSSVPLGTGPSASLLPSNSVSVSTAPTAPFPTSSGSLSASQKPSSVVPLGTGVTGAPSKVSIITSDSVLTYTIGSGSSTTVIITTIRHTFTSTLVRTIYATKSSATELGANNTPESPVGPTTTKRDFITSTAVITVYPVPSKESTGSAESPEGGQNRVKAVGSNCAPQVTVTVPGPEVTVTVTASAAAGSPSGAGEEATQVPTVSPLPSLSNSALFNNGTEAATRKSKTKCRSTGFLTSATASFTNKLSATSIFPTGTGVVHSY